MGHVPKYAGNMKKYLFLITLIALLVGITAFLYSRTATTKEFSALPTPTPLQEKDIRTLPIEPVLPTQKNISFTISFTPPVFPMKLPSYRVTSESFSLQNAYTSASLLGFSGNPAVDKSGPVTIYEWKKPDATLTIQTQPPSLSLLKEVSLVGRAPAADDAQKTIIQFIQQYQLVPSSVQTSLVNSSFLRAEGSNLSPSSPLNANVISVSYQHTINAYPLYQKSGLPSGISALLGPSGTTRSVSTSLLPSFQPAGSFPVFPVGQAILALQNNKGTLIGVESSTGETSLTEASFTSINLTGVSLAYVLFQEEKRIRPVYVFSGVAQNGGVSQGAKVTYIVSASP